MKKLLILGAGAVGSIVANKVSREMRREIARGEVEISVLDKNDTAVNQGGFTFIPFGLYTPEDITRRRHSLISPRVKTCFGQDGEVVSVDLADKMVRVKSGQSHSYDYLLIATGSECDGGGIPGLSEDFNTFYTGLDAALKLKQRLETMEKGRIVVLTTGMPISCPGAPGKFTTLLDDYLKDARGWKTGKDFQLSFLWPVSAVGPPEYNKLFTEGFKERGINDRRRFKVAEVRAGSKEVISATGEKIPYDLLITIPVHHGARAMSDSGISDENGWIPTDKTTLQYSKAGYEAHQNVYVAGDAGPAEIGKTGIGAHFQAIITAQNLVNDLRGEPVRVPYRGETGCPFVLESYTSARRGKAYLTSWTSDNPQKAFRPTEFGWHFYRMFYYTYWDTAIKGLA